MLRVLALLVLAASSVSAQTISGVSGTLTQGSTITLTGSAFGTKSAAAPLKFDLMNGTVGQRADARGWIVEDRTSLPVLVNTNLRGAAGETTVMSLPHDIVGGTDNTGWFGYGEDGAVVNLTAASIPNERPFPQRAFVATWVKCAGPSSTPAENNKILRFHSADGSSTNAGFASAAWQTPSEVWGYFSSGTGAWAVGTLDFSYPHRLAIEANPQIQNDDTADVWFQLKFATDFSPNAGEGQLHMWWNGTMYSNETGKTWPNSSVANWGWETQYLSPPGPDATPAPSVNYFDDMYFDDTWARIEMGNNATYDLNTHTEMQVPITWSSTSATFTLNRGTFGATDDVYLFLCDSDGDCSSGFAVTLGGDPPATPGPIRLRKPEYLIVIAGLVPLLWKSRQQGV